MRPNVLFAMIACLFFVGCNQAPPEPPPEEAPPPPTAQEVHRDIMSTLSVFQQTAASVGGGIGPAEKDQTVAAMRQVVGQLRATPNGPEGVDMARKDVEQLTKRVEEGDQRWMLLKGCIEAHHVIAPESTKYAKLEQRVDLMLARPRVIVRGFMEIDKQTHAFLEVTDRKTNAVKTYKVREGEDFHDVLRVLRIIGKNQAVELLYKPVDEPWIVRQPSEAYRDLNE